MKYLAWLLLVGSLLSDRPMLAKETVISQLDSFNDSSEIHKVPLKTTPNIVISRSTRNKDETLRRKMAQEVSIKLANDIAHGLVVAHQNKQIKHGTRMYRKVQTAIHLLRRGAGLEGASRRSGVSRSILDQLIEWGQQRPGALIPEVE
ncbi:hypothetical protein PCC8801_3582 [Rippkaea orientalis PCC 8801]|uniref:Uncharacterized protein n=2 Tax=Rippkaea TaxID=2546365 RepID=B7K1K3_RIPO1|nr:hypothetical protein PCC8801_3582 [Rippkaea orientalis PCC 8801]